ncbi:hypothetical protein JOD57_003606 [Geodermatophilus bullaregiensis]|uniref:hypothetical protein n=1 Tax=Geodermatophilus bullaregiensis TaxID=1564160 RepID=UPI00195BC389|nr:hypothetical protein [Geodermatophilus bullaregiensis]MBM7807769.1 hypothetical protein [Geodermatophilus bullaregiensis]
MQRGWELLVLLIIFGILLQEAVAFIRPLIPYVVDVVVLGGITVTVITVYRNHRSW